jgi:uncharacterized protein
MPRNIQIKAGTVTLEATLNDTKTADAIWNALPLRTGADTWGNEIYFPVPVKIKQENGQDVVNMGDLGYWPAGNAFCIFFGPTPVSRGNEIRPASAVTVFGKVIGDATALRNYNDGEEVIVTRKNS